MRPTNVLIAGSDAMTRTALAAVVSNLGFEVVTAADGREAWGAFTECPPDVAILCWERPDFDALDLCRRVRDSAGDNCIRLIVTSREAKADLMQAVAAGIDEYVSTPIDVPQFRARMVMAEERLRLRRETPGSLADGATATTRDAIGALPGHRASETGNPEVSCASTS